MTQALETLRSVFGYTAFRSLQEAVVEQVIAGGDAMVLMPTGGGKSLCYQIPALVRPGCGVVISPLIALMQDQVSALQELGVRAAFLNSTLELAAVRDVESRLLEGQLDMLYIAPERLVQPRTLDLLARTRIALFAIDEAHCVSRWGHDFRADYLQLNLLHERFPDVPRLALTATADARTREEIIQRLDLHQAGQFIAGFDRPNIRYRITLKDNPRQQLLRFLRNEHPDHSGIVYCLSRNKVEETAEWLEQQGFRALPYHAGLPATLRATHQARFLREEGIIMVATIAFGMGIDKPDVRFVAHLDMPRTLEAYYQETGRAGRDGLPADAWMVYGLQDVLKQRQMLDASEGNDTFKRAEQQRLNAMLGLCEVIDCRRQVLLRYFGDEPPGPCGNCDTCLDPVDSWDATEAARMALSAVYRTEQRFGVNHLIDVLRGSDTERVRQFGHQHLSTFGVGAHLHANQWRSVFRQLVARAYLDSDPERYGALRLTEQCRPLLRGEQTLRLRRDSRSEGRAGRARDSDDLDVDSTLWEALRDCRRQLAEEQGKPPYIIFGDRTLREMCIHLPRDIDAFGQLFGVGESKRDKYGEVFLRVIDSHLHNHPH